MKKTIYINQEKMLEWEIDLPHACIVDLFTKLPLWADGKQKEDGKIRYFFAKPKILSELPGLKCELDTLYRYCKKLVQKWLIGFKKEWIKDFWTLTDKIKEWDFNNSDLNPRKRQTLGFKSEPVCRKIFREVSDLNPTYKITILSDIWLDSKTTEILKDFSSEYYILYSKFEKHCERKKREITHEQREEILKQCAAAWNERSIKVIKRSISNGYYSLFFDEDREKEKRKRWSTPSRWVTQSVTFTDDESVIIWQFLEWVEDMMLRSKVELSLKTRRYNNPAAPINANILQSILESHVKH